MFTTEMRIVFTFILTVVFLFAQQDLVAQSKKKVYSKSRIQNGSDFLLDAKPILDSDPAKAVELLQKALENSIASKDYKIEGQSYFLLGKINSNASQYDLAISYFKKAQAAYANGNLYDEQYQLNKEYASALKLDGQFKEALKIYNDIFKEADRRKDIQTQIFVHRERASIYKENDELNKALRELEKAEKLSSAASYTNMSAEIQLEKGEVYELQQNSSLAFSEYESAENTSRKLNDKQGVINSNVRSTRLLEKQGKKEEAVQKQIETLNYLNEVEIEDSDYDKLGSSYDNSSDEEESSTSKQLKSEPLKNFASNNIPKLDKAKEESKLNIEIGKGYLDLEKNEEAIEYLKDAVDISSTSGSIQEEKEAYGLLSEAYSRAGQYTAALESYKNYVGLVDSIYNLKENQILASLDLSKELTERLQRISSLEKDRDIKEKTIALLESERFAEEESNKRLKTLIYSLIGGLLLLLLLLYFAYRNSRQRRITNQLLALKNLRTQMNPHFIFNALNSVNNFISQSDERSANKYLSEFSRLMRLVLENSEHDFIPLAKELEILNLYIGLEHSRFSEKFDYVVEIDPALNIEKYEIPPMIVQPYIENAVWHGLRYLEDKGNLFVKVAENEGVLSILIEDDGIGRKRSAETKTKNQKSNKSTAMKNITDRLNIINGLHRFEVNVAIRDLKEDGSGTSVKITVEERS